MDPMQLDTEPKSSPKVITEFYYFPSSDRILTQKKKKRVKRNKIIASYICKVMIKTLDNFFFLSFFPLNNFNNYLLSHVVYFFFNLFSTLPFFIIFHFSSQVILFCFFLFLFLGGVGQYVNCYIIFRIQ